MGKEEKWRAPRTRRRRGRGGDTRERMRERRE